MEDSLTSNQSRSIGEIGTRESSGPEHVDEDIVFVMRLRMDQIDFRSACTLDGIGLADRTTAMDYYASNLPKHCTEDCDF